MAKDEDVEEQAADAGSDDDNEVDGQVENALAAATAVEHAAVGSPSRYNTATGTVVMRCSTRLNRLGIARCPDLVV